MVGSPILLRSALRRPVPQSLRVRLLRQDRNARPVSSSPPPPNPTPKRDSNQPAAEIEDPIPVPNTVAPLPLWQRLGPLTSAANAYARSQKRRPWVTQFFSALVIYFFGDLSAQFIGGDEDYDPKRTARSLVIGGVSAIPSYCWFLYLSHHFNYASRIVSLATKIVINQLLFTPTFNTYFFGAQAFLSGGSPAEVLDRIVTAVPVSIVASCRLWPFVTAFSFTFVPIEHRSVFAGIVAIGWQTYLGLLNRRAEKKAQLEASMGAIQTGAESQA